MQSSDKSTYLRAVKPRLGCGICPRISTQYVECGLHRYVFNGGLDGKKHSSIDFFLASMKIDYYLKEAHYPSIISPENYSLKIKSQLSELDFQYPCQAVLAWFIAVHTSERYTMCCENEREPCRNILIP